MEGHSKQVQIKFKLVTIFKVNFKTTIASLNEGAHIKILMQTAGITRGSTQPGFTNNILFYAVKLKIMLHITISWRDVLLARRQPFLCSCQQG